MIGSVSDHPSHMTTLDAAVGTPVEILASVETPHGSFTSNVVTVLGGQAACAVVALLIEISYARLLGPAGRGQVSLCMMAIAVGAVIGGLGGEIPTVIWTANSAKNFSDWLPAVFLWGLVGSTAATGLWTWLYWAWHPAFLRGITPPLAAFVAATISINIAFVYLLSLVTGLERFQLRASLAFTNQVAELIGLFLAVWLLGRTASVALLGNLFGLVAAAGLSAIVLKDSLRGMWNFHKARHNFGAALSLGVRGQLGNLATFFNYRLDVFVVNYFLDPAQVGLYAIGVVVSESLWQIPHAAAVALFPRTARTIDRGAAGFTCLVSRQVLLLACILGVIMALLSPVIIPAVFGARFSPSVAVIWWILPGTVALAVGKVMSSDLAARGRPEYNSVFALVSLAVTMVLDMVLIPRMGIRGAALASSAAYFVDAGLVAIALKHQLKVSWRMLLVPSSTELGSYPRLWRRCTPWLRPATVSPETNGPGEGMV